MKRKTYRVSWRRNRWHVRGPRGEGPSPRFEFKYDAVQCARVSARLIEIVDETPSQVVVHDKRGKIQSEWSYGRDPRRTRG